MHTSNGQVERSIRTLEETISKYLDKEQLNWDLLLPICTFSINCNVHSSTKFSPYELVYGKKPMLPLDLLLGNDFSSNSVSDRNNTRMAAKQNLLLNQNYYGNVYNRKRIDYNYAIGSLCMVKIGNIPPKFSSKIYPKYYGPFRILMKIDDLHYKIRAVFPEAKKKIFVIHVNRMKPFGHSSTSSYNSDDHDHDDDNTNIVHPQPASLTSALTKQKLKRLQHKQPSATVSRPTSTFKPKVQQPPLQPTTITFKTRTGRSTTRPATYKV